MVFAGEATTRARRVAVSGEDTSGAGELNPPTDVDQRPPKQFRRRELDSRRKGGGGEGTEEVEDVAGLIELAALVSTVAGSGLGASARGGRSRPEEEGVNRGGKDGAGGTNSRGRALENDGSGATDSHGSSDSESDHLADRG